MAQSIIKRRVKRFAFPKAKNHMWICGQWAHPPSNPSPQEVHNAHWQVLVETGHECFGNNFPLTFKWVGETETSKKQQ
jgi:hypothetical protein